MRWSKSSKQPGLPPQENPQPAGRSSSSTVQQPKNQQYAATHPASYQPGAMARDKPSHSHSGQTRNPDQYPQQYGAGRRQPSPAQPLTGYSNNRAPEPHYQRQQPQQQPSSKQHASHSLAYRPATAAHRSEQPSIKQQKPMKRYPCFKEKGPPPPMLPGDRYTPRSSLKYPDPIRRKRGTDTWY